MGKSRQDAKEAAATSEVELSGGEGPASKLEDIVPPPATSAAFVRSVACTPGDVERLVAENEDLKRANIALESMKMRHEAALADLEEANRQNEEFIALLEAERERYRGEVSSLKSDRAVWMSQLWVLKKTYADYTQTIEAYERCCDRQAAEIKLLKEKLSELGCEVDLDEGQAEEVSQPTEPLPIVSDVIEPLSPAPSQDAAPGPAVEGMSADGPSAEQEAAEEPPLDLLDSKRLHEALEASAFFEDHEQPPSFSMPKGRLSR